MHIQDILAQDGATLSFEFFPPNSNTGWEELLGAAGELAPLKPSYVSVTYGAGGSTRDKTHDLVVRIKDSTGVEAVPHLTCVMHDKDEIDAILRRYAAAGVGNILALGGDPPKAHAGHDRATDDFRHAAQLVEHIKRFNNAGQHPHSKGFGVCVAGFPEGHPDTPNRLVEMDYLKAKVDAGADWICTQLFFDNRDFYDFRERCILAGINVPIVAGIMPVVSRKNLQRIAELAAGARIPAKLLKAVNRCGDDNQAAARVGTHWATEQCRDLLDHEVAGIHFYTLNRSAATRNIFQALGVKDTAGLRDT